jgi:hypothetical protein
VARVLVLGNVFEEASAIINEDEGILVFAAPTGELGQKVAQLIKEEDADGLREFLCHETYLCECGVDFSKPPACLESLNINGKKLICREDLLEEGKKLVLCISDSELNLEEYKRAFEEILNCLKEGSKKANPSTEKE